MKYLNIKDIKTRNNFFKIELELKRMKFFYKNRNISESVRFFFFFKVSHFSKKYSYVRIKNRCVFTNRSQSVYRLFKLNRSTFKHCIQQNMILGIRRSSW